MGKRTKSARKAAKKSSSSASVRRRRPLSSSKRERGNSNSPIAQLGKLYHSPLWMWWVEFPTARALLVSVPSPSSKRVRQNDDGNASLFSSKLSRCITHATLLIKYNNTRRNRDSARPRVKATKSGPNRKRMRSPPGWRNTDQVRHTTPHIRGSFPPPLSKGNKPNVVIHSRRRSTALLFGGVSFSLSLSRRRPLNRRCLNRIRNGIGTLFSPGTRKS